MALTYPRELRDPIHGLIRLTEREVAIVNTSVFQRLRRIRQLAMADLVYPGALHTRFEHSLGTVHVAHRILTRLDGLERLFDNDVEIVRLAALLHDVGHGPFSHVSESLLEEYYNKEKVGKASSREKIHEKVTVDIVTKNSELGSLLAPEERAAVADIIGGTAERDYRRDIISSSLDADKMDYLLRDAFYAGVRYGLYDLDKVVDACRIFRGGPESYLMVDEEGLFAVLQLVLAKYYMTQQVYAHRVRTITDSMIVRGLELAIEADDELRAAYAYDGSEEYLARYLTLDDARISAMVLSSRDERARTIFQRLRDRRLLKELALIPLDPRHVNNSVTRLQLLSGLTPERSRKLESDIATTVGCEPWEIIVLKKSLKNPAYQTPSTLDPEAVQVISREGIPKTLDQFDELVTAKLPATERLHVMGPFDVDKDLPRDKQVEARQQLEKTIRQVLNV